MSIQKNSDSLLLLKNHLKKLTGKNVSAWSKAMRFTEQAVHKWLGGSIPSADKILIICQKEKISADWLLTGKENIPAKHSNETKQLKEKLELKEEMLQLTRENAELFRNENTRLRDKIKTMKKNYLTGRRQNDSPDLDVAELRKKAM